MSQPSAVAAPVQRERPQCADRVAPGPAPVFGWLLLAESGADPTLRIVAAGVFIIVSLTDYVDL